MGREVLASVLKLAPSLPDTKASLDAALGWSKGVFGRMSSTVAAFESVGRAVNSRKEAGPTIWGEETVDRTSCKGKSVDKGKGVERCKPEPSWRGSEAIRGSRPDTHKNEWGDDEVKAALETSRNDGFDEMDLQTALALSVGGKPGAVIASSSSSRSGGEAGVGPPATGRSRLDNRSSSVATRPLGVSADLASRYLGASGENGDDEQAPSPPDRPESRPTRRRRDPPADSLWVYGMGGHFTWTS